jgi:hypothetical protein
MVRTPSLLSIEAGLLRLLFSRKGLVDEEEPFQRFLTILAFPKLRKLGHTRERAGGSSELVPQATVGWTYASQIRYHERFPDLSFFDSQNDDCQNMEERKERPGRERASLSTRSLLIPLLKRTSHDIPALFSVALYLSAVLRQRGSLS